MLIYCKQTEVGSALHIWHHGQIKTTYLDERPSCMCMSVGSSYLPSLKVTFGSAHTCDASSCHDSWVVLCRNWTNTSLNLYKVEQSFRFPNPVWLFATSSVLTILTRPQEANLQIALLDQVHLQSGAFALNFLAALQGRPRVSCLPWV